MLGSSSFSQLSSSSSSLLPSTYVRQAEEAKKAKEKKMQHLLAQRKLPEDGWSDGEIELLLLELAQMDSNNFPGNCGVGEREARIYSGLVARRHFGTGHGIGRSGDLCEVQPKAAGSSLLNRLTNALLLDLIRQFGVRSCKACFLVPTATGMALTLALLALKRKRPSQAKYVLWSRIDQKSCFKSIICAGYEPVILELSRHGDELRTDLDLMRAKIEELGADRILCVVTTTSCFAPRVCDDLPAVAKIVRQFAIPQVVNNAYGIQSSKCMHLLEELGRTAFAGSGSSNLDLFVQSTDKNLMVPVGGAVVAGFDKEWVQQISQTYPGRASSSPSLDAFITLLSLGSNGYRKLVRERKDNFAQLKEELERVAEKYGEKVLETKGNPISLAMTLTHVGGDDDDSGQSVSELGAMLFTRGVSGTRVLTGKAEKTIEGHKFKNWGSHSVEMYTPYLTAAAAIGMAKTDIDLFVKRLDKVLSTKARALGADRREKAEDKI